MTNNKYKYTIVVYPVNTTATKIPTKTFQNSRYSEGFPKISEDFFKNFQVSSKSFQTLLNFFESFQRCFKDFPKTSDMFRRLPNL